MYDKRLDGFLKTVQLGSFAKAGDALFISGNAVIKQVNGLERDLGAKLLRRTNHGVEPTIAGQTLAREAAGLIERAKALESKVRQASAESRYTVRLGASQMRPSSRVGGWWAHVAAEHPSIELQVVQMHDVAHDWDSAFRKLGEQIDVILTIEPLASFLHEDALHEYREVFRSPMCVAVPLGHPLSQKSVIDFADLEPTGLFVQKMGSTRQVDRFIELVRAKHPAIELMQIAPYEMDAYNTAARQNTPILNCRDLGELHPGFVNIACTWGLEYSLPFCLAIARNAHPAVREFIDAVCGEARREEGPTEQTG